MQTEKTPTDQKPCIRDDGPFAHIVAFDWYDGPLKGLAVSAVSADVRYFTMVDCDEPLDRREFALYQVDRSSYDECVRTLAQFDAPRHPVWYLDAPPAQVDVLHGVPASDSDCEP